MAVTVFRENHPAKFVLVDAMAAGDVFISEGVASEEQKADYLPAENAEPKKRGKQKQSGAE
jgi:hypothetical protein